MADLLVVGFKQDMYRASEVLNKLTELNDSWRLDLQDAVAVYRADNGTLRVDQSYQLRPGEGAAMGTVLGSLIGMLLAVPFTGGASAVAAGALAAGAIGGGALGAAGGAIGTAEWKDEYGISEEFVSQVGAMVQPGDSAILVLARSADPAKLAEQFRGYGGTALQTTLTKEQTAKLEQVLADRR